MDDRRPLRTVHHDELEKVPGAVGANDQEASRVLGDFLHDRCLADGVVDISFVDAVAQGSGQYIHTSESYYETFGLIERVSRAGSPGGQLSTNLR